tara:strand:- start:175397 stop:176404 length:1008 start_codon:yes stop_codon:yes gene_type:complete
LKFQSNFSLKNYNTFGIDVKAKRFISVASEAELIELLETEKDIFLISGGSNMLLTKDVEKTTVHIDIKGVTSNNIDENSVEVAVKAGENWHDFVLWCVAQNYGGLENLSLIPGNVGTCPIQNIGAYGVEVKDVISYVKAVHIETLKFRTFSNEECEFGYRNSIFKNELKGQFIITEVGFVLSRQNHQLNTSYGAINQQLVENGINQPNIKDISEAVIAIRSSKLPDPKEIGNSGSFFKNPVISMAHFQRLQSEYPEIPNYPMNAEQIKVPAGWLIEKAGFKGQRFGDAGVHERQALVLVNHGNATGAEVYDLACKIQNTIEKDFQIRLEMEVNIF